MPGALQQGAAGAATGWGIGGPVGAGVMGVLGLTGLLGGAPTEDPVMKQQRLFQQGIANQYLNQANAVPGSDPYSMAAFAQQQGLLGQQQRNTAQSLMGQYNPTVMGQSNLGDFMSNMASNFSSQRMSLDAAHMLDALNQRQQALMNASNVGNRAAALYQGQPNPLPQALGQLAQQMAYQKGRNQGQAQTQGVPGQTPYPTGTNPIPGQQPWGSGPPAPAPAPVPGAPPTSPAPGAGALSNPAFWQSLGMSPAAPTLSTPTVMNGVGTGDVPANFTGGAAGALTPGAAVQAAQGGYGVTAPPAAANMPFGMNSYINQIRQALLSMPTSPTGF